MASISFFGHESLMGVVSSALCPVASLRPYRLKRRATNVSRILFRRLSPCGVRLCPCATGVLHQPTSPGLPAFLSYVFRIPWFLHYRSENTGILFRATGYSGRRREVSHLNRTPLYFRDRSLVASSGAPNCRADQEQINYYEIGNQSLTVENNLCFGACLQISWINLCAI